MKAATEIIAFLLLTYVGVSDQVGDQTSKACSPPKFTENCPTSLINPSTDPCKTDNDCDGSRRCCHSDKHHYTISLCSDVVGSKEHLRCPDMSNRPLSRDSRAKCYSDANCGKGNMKCCFNRADCTSYCEVGVRSCFSLPNKPPGFCAEYPTSNYRSCSINDECPGNEVCCDVGGRFECSDPKTNSSGTCPTPDKVITVNGISCFADKDCPAKQKCCKFEGCSYFCSKTL